MADNKKFILINDAGVKKIVAGKQTDLTKPRPVFGLDLSDNIETLDSYLDLVKLLASSANKYENKMFFIKDMTNFGKYEPTATVHFKPGEPGMVYFDNDKTSIAATGSGVKHFIKVESEGIETVGNWNDLNAKITAGEKNVIYKVEDMAGYPGFADNEHAFWYLNGTTEPDLVSRNDNIYSKGNDDLLLKHIQDYQFASGGAPIAPITPLTANYNSQVDNLKVIESLSDLTPGNTKEYTFPNGLTTDTIGGCELAMNYTKDGEIGTTTQGFDLRGWDTTRPLYLSMTYHSNATYVWVEIKMEAVAGDNTKYKLTNFKSGAAGTEMNAFGVSSIQFKGGQ